MIQSISVLSSALTCTEPYSGGIVLSISVSFGNLLQDFLLSLTVVAIGSAQMLTEGAPEQSLGELFMSFFENPGV